MGTIEFNLTARDYMVAGLIRKAITEHRRRRNAQEARAHTIPTQAAPSASRDRATVDRGNA